MYITFDQMDLKGIILEAGQVILTEFRDSDTAAMNSMRNDPEVRKYSSSKPQEPLSETLALIHKIKADNEGGSGINFCIRKKVGPIFCGFIGLWRYNSETGIGELGYQLAKAHWNQRIMTEAMACFLEFATSSFALKQIIANVHRQNEHSIRLLDKNGFTVGERLDPSPDYITYYRYYPQSARP